MVLPIIIGGLAIAGGFLTILEYYANTKECPRCTKRVRIKNNYCACSCGHIFYV